MSTRFRRKKDGLIISWECVSLKSIPIYEPNSVSILPEFMRDEYEIIQPIKADGTRRIPDCGWEKLTLTNFEENMGYRFMIDKEGSMRGISRELAFLEFLESKGINRQERLIDGLTLQNFKSKTGHRFKRTKLDMERRLSKEQAFHEWKKRNGYT